MNLLKQNQKDRVKVGYIRLIMLLSVLFCFMANLRHSAYHHVKLTQVFAPMTLSDSFSDLTVGPKDDECLSCLVGRGLHLHGHPPAVQDGNKGPGAPVLRSGIDHSEPSFRSHILIPDSAGPPRLVA